MQVVIFDYDVLGFQDRVEALNPTFMHAGHDL